MRARFIAVTLIVGASCLFTVAQPPAPAEPRQAEAIDFDALHAQATAALETLQQSHQRRLASVAATAF